MAQQDLLDEYVKGVPFGLLADRREAERILVRRIANRHGIGDVECIHHSRPKRKAPVVLSRVQTAA